MERRGNTLLLLLILLIIIGGSVLGYVLWNVLSVKHPGGPGGNGGTAVVGKGCGVSQASSGYVFSWLHVAGGMVVDDKNCIVNLHGFNWSQLEFGNAVGGGPTTRISEEGIAWYAHTFKMNVWRIPVNATWWNQNVEVPLAGMRYQDWIPQIVRWAELNGNYVILTKGPQFQNPPCGGTITFCPSQNQGKKNVEQGLAGPSELTTGQYIEPAVNMWTSIARLYANDPAIIYDSWNEMHDIDPQTWYQSTNTLINTIRAQNPRALIFLGGPNYKGNINALIRGRVPGFTQPNIVYDFHVYNGYTGTYEGKNCNEPKSYVWQNWPARANEQVEFAQNNGKAVAFSEWGGCNNFAEYNQEITTYARQHHICLAYYDEANVAKRTNGSYQLTDNGIRVQAAYSLF